MIFKLVSSIKIYTTIASILNWCKRKKIYFFYHLPAAPAKPQPNLKKNLAENFRDKNYPKYFFA